MSAYKKSEIWIVGILWSSGSIDQMASKEIWRSDPHYCSHYRSQFAMQQIWDPKHDRLLWDLSRFLRKELNEHTVNEIYVGLLRTFDRVGTKSSAFSAIPRFLENMIKPINKCHLLRNVTLESLVLRSDFILIFVCWTIIIPLQELNSYVHSMECCSHIVNT